jgi:hypothetical protein
MHTPAEFAARFPFGEGYSSTTASEQAVASVVGKESLLGLATHESLRTTWRRLQRPTSTIGREVARDRVLWAVEC